MILHVSVLLASYFILSYRITDPVYGPIEGRRYECQLSKKKGTNREAVWGTISGCNDLSLTTQCVQINPVPNEVKADD